MPFVSAARTAAAASRRADPRAGEATCALIEGLLTWRGANSRAIVIRLGRFEQRIRNLAVPELLSRGTVRATPWSSGAILEELAQV
jgi:hypothetical protein